MSPAFEETQWVVVSGAGITIPEGVALSATFENGAVSGSTGCNRFSAAYTGEGEKLEIGTIAATLMACAPPLDAVESAYVTALGQVAARRLDGDALVLLDADGAELLRYETASPAGEWQLTGLLAGERFSSPVVGTEVTASFAEGATLSGSAGCNRYHATYTAGGGALEISPPASTRMACGEPDGVMEQESRYLALLPTTAGYRVGGRTLELSNADGMRILAYTRTSHE